MYRIININGTSKQALLDQYRAVAEALRTLQEAMGQAPPHGRDFQLNPDDYRAARDNHFAMQQKLNELEDNVSDIVMNLSFQGRS